MKTLTEVADSLDAVAKRLPIAAGNAKKDIARAILNDLTQVTPADTGAAISNWMTTVGLPSGVMIPAYVPSPRGRMIGGVWTHTVDPTLTAQANAPITFEKGKIAIDAALPGEPIFISNMLPYIEVLDQGSSEQVPAGFVDRAVILGRLVAEEAKLL